jgi:hypothetical protein
MWGSLPRMNYLDFGHASPLCTPASCLPGDKVVVQWDDHWVAGRVLSTAECGMTTRRRQQAPEGELIAADMKLADAVLDPVAKEMARVSFSLPCTFSVRNGYRRIPGGTPAIRTFSASQMQFIEREPDWDPYGVKPFLTPEEFELRHDYGKSMEAYVPPGWYSWGDYVWVWNQTWHPAEIGNSEGGWIRLRHGSHTKTSQTLKARGYRGYEVWPILCDHSAPYKALSVSIWDVDIDVVRKSKRALNIVF